MSACRQCDPSRSADDICAAHAAADAVLAALIVRQQRAFDRQDAARAELEAATAECQRVRRMIAVLRGGRV